MSGYHEGGGGSCLTVSGDILNNLSSGICRFAREGRNDRCRIGQTAVHQSIAAQSTKLF